MRSQGALPMAEGGQRVCIWIEEMLRLRRAYTQRLHHIQAYPWYLAEQIDWESWRSDMYNDNWDRKTIGPNDLIRHCGCWHW